LLEDKRIKPHSNVVLTHKPFIGPYYIGDVVKGRDNIGPAYRLIAADSGKSLKRLVSGDRLKKFSADRTDLTARLPLRSDGQTSNRRDADAGQASTTTNFTTPDLVPMCYDPAIRILKE